MLEIRRARPWLGTFVAIRVGGLAEADALGAIDAAFAEVAAVHRLMSFHERDSDLSRLHRAAVSAPVPVDARTCEVLEAALTIAEESHGCFDPTIAAQLVAWGLLPKPTSSGTPDPQATWRDIELLDGSRVRFRRPLWLDLGGIAKGYAVDRALAVLRGSGATMGCVNAGGDLRRFGARPERVELRLAAGSDAALPSVDLTDAAVATSIVDAARDHLDRRWRSGHLNARTGRSIRAQRAVSVVAETCIVADALTKVVLADARLGERLLRRHRASACLHDGKRGWRMLGDA